MIRREYLVIKIEKLKEGMPLLLSLPSLKIQIDKKKKKKKKLKGGVKERRRERRINLRKI